MSGIMCQFSRRQPRISQPKSCLGKNPKHLLALADILWHFPPSLFGVLL
jgi:hypothetical protein